MPKCRRDARFLFARKRCPTGGLILEGAPKKLSEPRIPIGFFLARLWNALAPPNKAKRKGLQMLGRRRRVFQRSRLKEGWPHERGSFLFLQTKVPNWSSDLGGCPKKTFWNKAFSIRLWNKLAPKAMALTCTSSPKQSEAERPAKARSKVPSLPKEPP